MDDWRLNREERIPAVEIIFFPRGKALKDNIIIYIKDGGIAPWNY